MRTKKPFIWQRSFSSLGPVTVPAGAPVEWNVKNQCFYVEPVFFAAYTTYMTRRDYAGRLRYYKPQPGGILYHDATYYGCRVAPENVGDINGLQ